MLAEHLAYVSDVPRLARYATAISRVVRPGDIVVDLGCGTGVLGLLCLQSGAAHVHAIDDSGMLEVARESFRRAGFIDRVSLHSGYSTHVTIPARADLIVCDQVGYFGFDAGIVPALEDARRRFLKPGGRVIPETISLFLSASESAEHYGAADGWTSASVPQPLHWIRSRAINQKRGVRLKSDDLLCTGRRVGEIDLRSDGPEFRSWNAELIVSRTGTLHGLVGWFEANLVDDVWMTNAPDAEHAINRPQAFLPIDRPVHLAKGTVLSGTVMARPADDLLAWRLEIPSVGLSFAHSTWFGGAADDHQISSRGPGNILRRTRGGEARRIVLEYCDGQSTLVQIRHRVISEHPDLFPSERAAARFVSAVLAKDAE